MYSTEPDTMPEYVEFSEKIVISKGENVLLFTLGWTLAVKNSVHHETIFENIGSKLSRQSPCGIIRYEIMDVLFFPCTMLYSSHIADMAKLIDCRFLFRNRKSRKS